jgi:hypothetical protein
VALAERGIPALGIDTSPGAVEKARCAGALVMLRDVFGRVPGAGRWMTVLLADGTIGIGGDPAALLRRAGELLAPPGRALVELSRSVGADRIEEVARAAGLGRVETWTAGGRWFAAVSRAGSRPAGAPLLTGSLRGS